MDLQALILPRFPVALTRNRFLKNELAKHASLLGLPRSLAAAADHHQ